MPLLPRKDYQPNGRIYFSISSEGFGHSSRALALASQFPRERVLVGAYSYALERVQAFGLPVVPVSQELKFVGSDGSFDVGRTILENPTRALGLTQIVQDECDIIKDSGASLVVADGRIAPVLAASRMEVPCVVVTNQSAFYPFFARDSALVKAFGRSFEWVMRFWLSSAEEILIPDFPPPHTVCLPNLSAKYKVKKRTRFVGPLVAWQADDIVPIEKPERPLVVVSLGGHAYRRPLFDAVLRVAQCRSDLQFILLSSFLADRPLENVTILGQVKDCSSYFKAADVIITQAGHSTAMEVLTLGKPTVVVPDTRQIEQENNAKRMQELGVSERVEYSQLGDDTLLRALDTVLSTPAYRQQAEMLAAEAKHIHGARQAAAVLDDYATRLLAY
jgi:UDP-N-acetylglucosamine--N-acetylmuramyl-(pentapeptide) pyrophosphoryl-undecaprenol N-acetylglucosamine transferase